MTTVFRKGCKDVPRSHKPQSLSSIGAHWETVKKNRASRDFDRDDGAFQEGSHVSQKLQVTWTLKKHSHKCPQQSL